jgi:hypothetical protein
MTESGSGFGSVAGEDMAAQTEIVGLPDGKIQTEAEGKQYEKKEIVEGVSGDDLGIRRTGEEG